MGVQKHYARQQLPAEVEVEIISRLFNALPQVLCVTTGLMVGSAFMVAYQPDAWTITILVLAVLTSISRIVGILAFRGLKAPSLSLEQARAWERAYAYPAIAFTVAIALFTVCAFRMVWIEGEIIAVGLTMSLTAGSCARTLRYWLCTTLSTIALGALIVMLFASGDLVRVGIGLLFGLYLYSVFESSRHIVGQVEALLIAERELDIQARRDVLTGIANRRAFDEGLASACAGDGAFALLMLDLDGFKSVNDTFGHAAGDELLRQVAGRLSSVSRDGDLLARLGGDEFAMILRGADRDAAEAVGQRAIRLVSKPYVVLGADARVGTSVGIEISEGKREPASLKDAADRALYAAKRAGKGRIGRLDLRAA